MPTSDHPSSDSDATTKFTNSGLLVVRCPDCSMNTRRGGTTRSVAPSVPIAVAPGAPPFLASRTGVNHTVQGAAETTEPESRRRGPSGNTNAADYATIAEIAAAEKINGSYVGRVLRLALLA
jgi:hypothetical protein